MRSPFPLKKGEGKGEGMVKRCSLASALPRKISPLGQSRLLLPSVEMTKETHSTSRKNRAPENRRRQPAEIFGNSSLFFLRRMLRASGTKFDTNSIFSKNIAPFIDRGGISVL